MAKKFKKKSKAPAAPGQELETQGDEGSEDEVGSVVVVNHGPQDYRESKQSFPVGQEVTVTEDVAERLVNDFQGSKFHSFEVVEGAEPDTAGDGENGENGGG
jgi:hypothetical protein